MCDSNKKVTGKSSANKDVEEAQKIYQMILKKEGAGCYGDDSDDKVFFTNYISRICLKFIQVFILRLNQGSEGSSSDDDDDDDDGDDDDDDDNDAGETEGGPNRGGGSNVGETDGCLNNSGQNNGETGDRPNTATTKKKKRDEKTKNSHPQNPRGTASHALSSLVQVLGQASQSSTMMQFMQAQQQQFMNMMLLSRGSLMPPVVTPTMTPMMGGTMNGENNSGSSVLPVMGQHICPSIAPMIGSFATPMMGPNGAPFFPPMFGHNAAPFMTPMIHQNSGPFMTPTMWENMQNANQASSVISTQNSATIPNQVTNEVQDDITEVDKDPKFTVSCDFCANGGHDDDDNHSEDTIYGFYGPNEEPHVADKNPGISYHIII